MIRRAYPSRFDRPAETGRTEPLRISLLTEDGVEHDVVMKVSDGPECSVEGLANEMLGSLLAADLELPINEPFFVELDPLFVDAVFSENIRLRLKRSNALAFASLNAGQQWRRWNASDKLIADQIGLALAVLAFDAFIGNSDRSPVNPNLLVRDNDWRLIDHESAFGFRMKLFPRCEPWNLGNLNLLRQHGQPSEHLFARHLIGRSDLDFVEIRQRWAGLSDARLSQYDATLPDEWNAVRPIFAEALDHLRAVRDRIDLCLDEIKRVLS